MTDTKAREALAAEIERGIEYEFTGDDRRIAHEYRGMTLSVAQWRAVLAASAPQNQPNHGQRCWRGY